MQRGEKSGLQEAVYIGFRFRLAEYPAVFAQNVPVPVRSFLQLSSGSDPVFIYNLVPVTSSGSGQNIGSGRPRATIEPFRYLLLDFHPNKWDLGKLSFQVKAFILLISEIKIYQYFSTI